MAKGPEFLGLNDWVWWIGIVEDVNDPLELGRVKCRVNGWYGGKKDVPTDKLPWAYTLMPCTSASFDGMGTSPVGLKPGSWVMGFFMDGTRAQKPAIMGTWHALQGGGQVPGSPAAPKVGKQASSGTHQTGRGGLPPAAPGGTGVDPTTGTNQSYWWPSGALQQGASIPNAQTAPRTGTGIVYPVNGSLSHGATSGFQSRSTYFHNGVDAYSENSSGQVIAGPGAVVYAMEDTTINVVNYNSYSSKGRYAGGYGVMIQGTGQTTGAVTQYGHIQPLPGIAPGVTVKAGQPIAVINGEGTSFAKVRDEQFGGDAQATAEHMNANGWTTGKPHAHIRTTVNGKGVNPGSLVGPAMTVGGKNIKMQGGYAPPPGDPPPDNEAGFFHAPNASDYDQASPGYDDTVTTNSVPLDDIANPEDFDEDQGSPLPIEDPYAPQGDTDIYSDEYAQDQHSVMPEAKSSLMPESQTKPDAMTEEERQSQTDFENADGTRWCEPRPKNVAAPHKSHIINKTQEGQYIEQDSTPGNSRTKIAQPVQGGQREFTYLEMDDGGNMDMFAAGDVTVGTPKTVRLGAKGHITLASHNEVQLHSKRDMKIKSGGVMSISTGKQYDILAEGSISISSGEELILEGKAIKMTAGEGGIDIRSEEELNLEAKTELQIQAGEFVGIKGLKDVMISADAAMVLHSAGSYELMTDGELSMKGGEKIKISTPEWHNDSPKMVMNVGSFNALAVDILSWDSTDSVAKGATYATRAPTGLGGPGHADGTAEDFGDPTAAASALKTQQTRAKDVVTAKRDLGHGTAQKGTA